MLLHPPEGCRREAAFDAERLNVCNASSRKARLLRLLAGEAWKRSLPWRGSRVFVPAADLLFLLRQAK